MDSTVEAQSGGAGHLCGCARHHEAPGDGAPVALAELGEAHQEQAVLLLCPGDALPPLLLRRLGLLRASITALGRPTRLWSLQ